jgi:hypothetical protein
MMSKIQTYFEMRDTKKWFRIPRKDIRALYEFYREQGLQCTAYVVAPDLPAYSIMAKIYLGKELHVRQDYTCAGLIVNKYFRNHLAGMLMEARAGCKKLGLKFKFKPAEIDCQNFWYEIEASN